jgi:hypothetical protein
VLSIRRPDELPLDIASAFWQYRDTVSTTKSRASFTSTLAGIVVGVFAAGSPWLKAATIYSDLSLPTNYLYVIGPLNGQVGDEVHAAGTERLVTKLEIGIYPQGGNFPQGTPGAGNFQARLYANDGVGGQPRSLLWQSPVIHVSYPGNVSLLSFDVPQVLVPDDFTWTLSSSNEQPYPVGEVFSGVPTVGSSGNYSWFTDATGTSWTRQTLPGDLNNLMAQIEAVPEPGAAVMLAFAATVWSFCRRTREERPVH